MNFQAGGGCQGDLTSQGGVEEEKRGEWNGELVVPSACNIC